MKYQPQPIQTEHIRLPAEILELAELLAKNTHDVWAKERMEQGWRFGEVRDDEKKEHPCLIPYEDLPESEKVFDRNTAMETLKAITALGYEICNERRGGR